MPGSWETLEMRRNRVLVAVIQRSGDRVSFEWAKTLRGIQLPNLSAITDIKGYPYDAARNRAARICLDNGFGYLFFLDTDVLVPHDVVTKLMETGRDLIGALYRRRHPPFDLLAANIGKDPKGEMTPMSLENYRPGEIVSVDFLPTGATLISRRCLETMFARFPRPYTWAYDVAPVPDGVGGSLPQVSEDYIFSLRAKAIGFTPWVATGLWCSHEIDGVLASEKGTEYAH